ncbi:hypothetical protein BG011_009569 [Mortierella polycephala]|uniref:GH18 domain-containing protein n=1 Tax=Mortierella polycephala TaxID=41804 RepID=A0A9P6PMN0_9FUNG|nr:hypothetical protein BG011_009569 [Mortierella polycephala]
MTKHRSKKRHGYDLQERKRKYPNRDGRKLRVPSTVSKMPLNSTLVNIAYFPGWTQFRGQGENGCRQRPYLPSTIPWSSLDYVMFAFVYFDDDNQLYPADSSDESLYFAVNEAKLATRTRVMISIGGWTFTHPETGRDGNTGRRFENMIRSSESRNAFIKSCIEFCQFYGFDGVDIDYEYPVYKDRKFVTALFQEMRRAFESEGSGLILSLAGASFPEGVQGFELDKVAASVDFVMVMAYDLYGAYDSNRVVNIHTTLVQMPTEKHSGHSVQGAVELYIDRGVPRQKVVLGLALYGKTFILADTQQTLPGQARFSSGGDPTSCTETRGDIAYNEIASLIHPGRGQSNQVRPLWDDDAKAFYFMYGSRSDNWVGYDDRPSLDLKLQMVTELDLAGVMWWSLDQDLDPSSKDIASHTQSQVQPRSIPQAPFQVANTFATNANISSMSEVKVVTESAQKSPLTGQLQENRVSKNPALMACPVATAPPAWMATISNDVLGQPGLVPYIASKRTRCLTVVQFPLILPATPVGNSVLVRCNVPRGCIETWQAFTCTFNGWSTGTLCYEKHQLSPSLYFYGELELVRAASRDRDIQDGATGLGPARASSQMDAQIESKRPEYNTGYLKPTPRKAKIKGGETKKNKTLKKKRTMSMKLKDKTRM